MNHSSRLVIGQYFPGSSFIHNSHPIVKILLLFFFCILVFSIKKMESFLFFYPIILSSFYITKVPLRIIIAGLKPLFLLLLITFSVHLFSTEGEKFFRLSFLIATHEGAIKGCFYLLRILLIVLASSLLTISTSPVEITYGLERILKPLGKIGFPNREFALMLAISLRFIPVLMEEFEKLYTAQLARGAGFKSRKPSLRVNAWLSILIPLFHSAFERADNLATAMEIRGFSPDKERSSLRCYNFGKADAKLLLIFGLLSASLFLF
jgi:energy-coupling factor transport system permease protein